MSRLKIAAAVVVASVLATQPSTSLAGSTDRAVPRAFVPESFTAVSEGDFWVLGSVPCAQHRCSVIVRTTDGGSRFVRIPAPPLAGVGPAGAEPTLRFADRLDGFAFVALSPALYTTHDGGTSWHRLWVGDVMAFATGGGNVYLVTAHCSREGCRHFRFEWAPVSGDAWRVTALPFSLGGFPDLAAHGSNVWLLGTPPSGLNGSGHDELARSSDGGRIFVTGPGPCVPGLGGELDSTSARVVWAMCPTGLLAAASRSSDGGVTFAPLHTPPIPNSAQLAPASSKTAVLVRDGGDRRLLRTTDAGRHWTTAHTPAGATLVAWVGFTDARVGAALVQTHWDFTDKVELQVLWRTTTGGARWSRVRFR